MARPFRVNDVMAEVVGFSERAIGEVQLRAFQAIASGMPTDTGFARGSITPTVGGRRPSVLARPRDRAQAKTAGETMFRINSARAKGIQLAYRLSQGAPTLTMRAGYVIYLNRGTSSQAPRNFIERAVAESVEKTDPT